MIFGGVKKKVKKSVSATLYPERILITTLNLKDDYIKYSTDQFVFLSADVSEKTLGESLVFYLANSEIKNIDFEEIRSLYNSLKKLAKFKTDKSMMIDSKLVNVNVEGDMMSFVPFKNMLTKDNIKSYYQIPAAIVTIPYTDDFEVIGKQLRHTWMRCEFA